MKRGLIGGIVFLGCALFFALNNDKGVTAGLEDVTFNNQVVRIFQRSCQSCHHPGDIAPFSLMSYEDARPHALSIKSKTQAREMPPWKAIAGCAEYENERVLTDEEIQTLARWVDSGAPEGDPADLPQPLTFNDDWSLGQPDAVFQPDREYTIRGAEDIYRCFSIPTDFGGDRFVSAVEIKPGNREVVHHVILYLDETGESKRLDDADPGPGYDCFGGPGFNTTGTLGGWAPGTRSRYEPEGTGWRLPKGARIVMQVHYHPYDAQHGSIETDLTQVGIYFARKPVRKELRVLPLINTSFVLPAGEPRQRVNAFFIIPPGFNATALSIAPHMHLLGREMKVEATYLNGSTRCLIDIKDWDFNWQGFYYFKEPVPLPAFTRLNLTAYYDNSAGNPRNPNSPPKEVRWGEETTDEMCIAFFEFTLDAENLEVSSPQITGVSVDSRDRLVVNGRGFNAGADIEIDGHRVPDTVNHKKKKKASKQLISNSAWKALATRERQVSVTVLNTDGVRAAAFTFTP